MNACQDHEEVLTLYAARALEPAEEARLRAHLASCEGCRREVESTEQLLAEVALPPPSPAEREEMEALPRRALGAWRRAQVRKAFRARTVGALLAAAAAVLVVVNPSLHRSVTPAPAAPPAVPATVSETQADFEQWAAADPLSDVLDAAGIDDDSDSWDDSADGDSSMSDLFLNLDSGDSL